jgi:hypothetical protein
MCINIGNVQKKENLDKVVEEFQMYKRSSECLVYSKVQNRYSQAKMFRTDLLQNENTDVPA